MSNIAIGSIPENGLSNKINLGLQAIAFTISTLLRYPPDKVCPMLFFI